MSIVDYVRETIKTIDREKIAVYPYGIAGYLVTRVLINDFGICPIIIDNYKSKISDRIYDKEYLITKKDELFVIIATHNPDLEEEICNELDIMGIDHLDLFRLKKGKHSFGGLINKQNGWLIESIGAFCSFAEGTRVVSNHNISRGVSTSAFFYGIDLSQKLFVDGKESDNLNLMLHKRTKIGNDVWLGQNVILMEGITIGDGAIVGAGSVVTHDVPDYAIVVGVPGRIMKYRYSKDIIQVLQKIQWWNWDDSKILESYDDFKDINSFVNKHG